jgi:hypothetical protein
MTLGQVMSLLKVGFGYGGLVFVRLRSRESDEKRKRRDQREPVRDTSFYTFLDLPGRRPSDIRGPRRIRHGESIRRDSLNPA